MNYHRMLTETNTGASYIGRVKYSAENTQRRKITCVREKYVYKSVLYATFSGFVIYTMGQWLEIFYLNWLPINTVYSNKVHV